MYQDRKRSEEDSSQGTLSLLEMKILSGGGNMVPGEWSELETVFTAASCPVEKLKDLAEGETFPNGPLVETQRAWRAALVS